MRGRVFWAGFRGRGGAQLGIGVRRAGGGGAAGCAVGGSLCGAQHAAAALYEV